MPLTLTFALPLALTLASPPAFNLPSLVCFVLPITLHGYSVRPKYKTCLSSMGHGVEVQIYTHASEPLSNFKLQPKI